MTSARLVEGPRRFVFAAVCGVLLALGCGESLAADAFPFDQELLLDARPMRPGARRLPILTVEPNGAARIDLWCKTVAGHVEFADAAIKIEAGPVPEALPQMMIDGQCTPERMQADMVTLSAITQVTEWRRQGGMLVLIGPTTLKFRASDH